MTTAKRRILAGALTLTLFSGALPHNAAANNYPWFRFVSGPAATEVTGAGLGLLWSFMPFWQYHEGMVWAQYAQLRIVKEELPAIYTARSAAPLPSLPSRPEPAPAPEPAPEPAPAPAPEPAPEPAPAPAPAPAPEPAPAPAPAPAPEPAPTPQPTGLTEAERALIDLVNGERAKAGLPALQVDLRLVVTARAKSQDMITYDYFGHESARLGSPFDQMKAAGIAYRSAGENLAGNGTVAGAHQSLMNSPGHRANILSATFTKIGIGVVKGGPYGMMFTQQFIAN